MTILDIGNNKNKCQKFTPPEIVKKMLDLANYKTNLMGKTVLENSFGSGNILKSIVLRYIESALGAGEDRYSISKGLSNDIYGVELDKELYNECIAELNRIISDYNLPHVDWKLFNGNALELNFGIQFDFIIGNPPYISYQEMDLDTRKELRAEFQSCNKGKFDYCYAFIEHGINALNDKGKMVQLVPNNIFKNVFAQDLRNILVDHICAVYDYPDQKLFEKTLTSVSIFLYDKSSFSEKVHYKNATGKTSFSVNRTDLKGKWIFAANGSREKTLKRFGDLFHASITIATLYNKAYLVESDYLEREKLEEEAIRETASPKTLRYGKKKYIIFPYKYDNGSLERYSALQFEDLFPNVSKHLRRFEEYLQQRDSDRNNQWFEYGRSQALTHLNSEKLLLSTIVTNRVDIYRISKEVIPFSGIFITTKDSNYTLDDALTILRSHSFMEYVRRIGISISGQSLRITCKDINNYLFSEEE